MKNLEQQLDTDFLTAYKAKKIDEKNFLGLLRSEIQNAKKLKSYREDTPLTILKRMKDSLEEGAKKGHQKSINELEILNRYLPKLMSEEEIEKIVNELFSNGNTTIPTIMKNFNIQYRGKADNRKVKEIAETLLNEKSA
jgi:uncharacterized protein YqeY